MKLQLASTCVCPRCESTMGIGADDPEKEQPSWMCCLNKHCKWHGIKFKIPTVEVEMYLPGE